MYWIPPWKTIIDLFLSNVKFPILVIDEHWKFNVHISREKVTKRTLVAAQAFTLMELVVALSMIAIMGLTVYSIFSQGLGVQAMAKKTEKLYHDVRWSVDRIAGDLERMVPYTIVPGTISFFKGTKDQLVLIVPTEKGLTAVKYSLESPERIRIHTVIIGETKSKLDRIVLKSAEEIPLQYLVREEIPLSKALTKDWPEKTAEEVLSTQVIAGSLKFFYAYRPGAGETTDISWKPDWSETVLPAGVRMEISFFNSRQPKNPMEIEKDVFVPTGSWGRE